MNVTLAVMKGKPEKFMLEWNSILELHINHATKSKLGRNDFAVRIVLAI